MRRRQRWGSPAPRYLAARCKVRVRFQEVDSLRVVWHGHYLNYFEEGRNAFGRKFGFGYRDILEAGYVAPLVHVELDYFRPARFDQILAVETRMHLDPGARIQFSYLITDGETAMEDDATDDANDIPKIATGRSVQVFTEADGSLMLTQPSFYLEFLDRWADAVEEP